MARHQSTHPNEKTSARVPNPVFSPASITSGAWKRQFLSPSDMASRSDSAISNCLDAVTSLLTPSPSFSLSLTPVSLASLSLADRTSLDSPKSAIFTRISSVTSRFWVLMSLWAIWLADECK